MYIQRLQKTVRDVDEKRVCTRRAPKVKGRRVSKCPRARVEGLEVSARRLLLDAVPGNSSTQEFGVFRTGRSDK